MLTKKLATEKKTKKTNNKSKNNKPESRIGLVHFHPKHFYCPPNLNDYPVIWLVRRAKDIHCISSGSSGGIQRSFFD